MLVVVEGDEDGGEDEGSEVAEEAAAVRVAIREYRGVEGTLVIVGMGTLITRPFFCPTLDWLAGRSGEGSRAWRGEEDQT